jgi:hypothetical protein
LAGAANVTVTKRLGATTQLEKICDGTSAFVTASGATAATIDLDDTVTDLTTAGIKVDNAATNTVSFEAYVPMLTGISPGDTTSNFLALGILVKGDESDAVVSDSEDTGIFTHLYARPWDAGGPFRDMLLEPCSSPTDSSAPCYVSGTTGVFRNDGSTALDGNPTYSIAAMLGSGGQQSLLDVNLGLTGASSSGFAVPATSIVKFLLSLPTTGTFPSTGTGGVNFANINFAQAAGGTKLRINPNGAPAANQWTLTTTGVRRVITVVGEARATSSAVDRNSWREDGCSVSVSGGAATSTNCGEGMTSNVSSTDVVLTTVPAGFNLSYSSDPVMQTIAGGLVSTNAQGLTFGEETMTGTSFQFGVAGPSYDTNGNSRSTDGFYYVCVPAAFLSGSFGTTPADASSLWIGTRDGVTTGGTTFAVGTCGIGAGLVATLDPFGYSSPLFRVKPPAAVASSPASSGSTEPATIPTVSTPVVEAAPTVTPPTVAPVILPTLSGTHPVAQGYLLSLADWTPGPGAKVSISIPRMFQKACRVVDGRVAAIAAGTCGVRITVVSPTGRRYVRRVHLTARV